MAAAAKHRVALDSLRVPDFFRIGSVLCQAAGSILFDPTRLSAAWITLDEMAGKKRTPAPPDWYVPETYRSAEDLDAGDWLLNLTLRRWLHGGAQPQTEDALRRTGPVLRRGDDSQIKQMHLADLLRWVYSFGLSEWDDPFGASTRHVSHPRR